MTIVGHGVSYNWSILKLPFTFVWKEMPRHPLSVCVLCEGQRGKKLTELLHIVDLINSKVKSSKGLRIQDRAFSFLLFSIRALDCISTMNASVPILNKVIIYLMWGNHTQRKTSWKSNTAPPVKGSPGERCDAGGPRPQPFKSILTPLLRPWAPLHPVPTPNPEQGAREGGRDRERSVFIFRNLKLLSNINSSVNVL